jgi:putative GTP pyrophosphokinase
VVSREQAEIRKFSRKSSARVNDIIAATFRVHVESSIDKSEALGADRVGYRSLHLICDLGEDRLRLPEFRRFSDCKFEIQIRTALQHAWAEIEHDRGYKLRGALPSHLKRKFSLLAGLLELADTQFDELSQAIEKYSEDVAKKANEGYLSIELNSSSVRELLALKIGEPLQDPFHSEIWPELLRELKDFGVGDLRALDALITPDVRDQMIRSNPERALPGFVRDAMMLNDIDRYFAQSWKRHWSVLDWDSFQVLSAKYGRHKINDLLDTHDIGREWEFEDYEFDEDR